MAKKVRLTQEQIDQSAHEIAVKTAWLSELVNTTPRDLEAEALFDLEYEPEDNQVKADVPHWRFQLRRKRDLAHASGI